MVKKISKYGRIRIRRDPQITALPDPDPSFRLTDPRIRIQNKYLRIYNTVKKFPS